MKHANGRYDYTVMELFEEQASKTPKAIAISYQTQSLTYQALNEKANQIANWLQQHQVNAGSFVGILLEPGLDFIISMLAIIKTGAIYIPLDALAPPQRLADIVNDANPIMVISSQQYEETLTEHKHLIRLIKHLHLESAAYPRTNPTPDIRPTSPLYMMYTSGSTGRPKGVIIPHQAMVNLMKIEATTKIQAGEAMAQFSNLAFDGSSFEIWCALLNGAKLVVVPHDIRFDHLKFKQYLEMNRIKHLFLPTGYFHQLVKTDIDTLNEISVLVLGGEQVNTLLLRNFLTFRSTNKLPIVIINGYGPTEATAYTCRQVINEHSVMDDDHISSIGKAIKNVKTYILDENHNPVTEGELCVSGINLAIGYYNCPIQNKEKFIPNPFCQEETYERLYKTGDRVRALSSGDLMYLGRLDDQVKIGGFRIHLNEIENQLMHYPNISLAAVTVETGGGAHKMLAAYLVLSSKETIVHADEIRLFLSESLPTYMLPAKYVMVDELPLTPIGKVDKGVLNTIPHTDLSYHVDTSSTSPIEETIKTIWQHLLNRTVIDVNKNLFDLGASSLLITEACVKINEALHSELQVSNLLTYPTIHKLSRFLEGDIEAPLIKKIKKTSSSDIAIIGMSCRFPEAESLDAFWNNLCGGVESLERFSEEELDKNRKSGAFTNKDFVPVRGILSDIDQFDANFFGFSPVDASITDPQQRLFLECAWEALEHAGVAPSKIGSKTISVFAGMADSSYLHENLLRNHWFCKEHDRFQQRLVTSTSMLSTQVSYRLNLQGRSLNINTACSTGLVTVAQACQELLAGSSDVSLAGAVSIVVPQKEGYIYKEGSIESPDGQCRPFDNQANGTVFSNGVGVVILKRLEDAIKDCDTIYAVIKGCGVNNDGLDKLGYMAPSTSGQSACIREAFAQSEIGAEDVGYIEAHGTATALGDVIEIEALSRVFQEQTEREQFCVLGSVKGNIGHTDIAAGMAGIIKTALCLYHQKIPPTLHFKESNPNLSLATSPFFINKKLRNWKGEDNKRYAGVSAFGVGGTNAHLILNDYVPNSQRLEQALESVHDTLFILSAKTEKALEENSQKLIAHLALMPEHSSSDLENTAYTLQTGREDFQWRQIGVGKTPDELSKQLRKNTKRLSPLNTHFNVTFMFPGQGTQYHGMASQLIAEIPYFACLIEKGCNLAKSYLNCDLLEIIQNPQDLMLNETQYAQPALFIFEYSLAKLLIHYGVLPTAFIGHSLGEYVAACLSGVFSFEDAIALVCERGLLMASVEKGKMLAIECSIDEFRQYQKIADVDLAVHNSINHCVASGSARGIEELEQHLLTLEKPFQKLKVSHAFHSRSMEEIEQSFKMMFSNISLSAPLLPIISNVHGDWLSPQEAMDPEYWYRHLRETVQLCKGIKTLLADEHTLFIEVGPGQSLSLFLKGIAKQETKELHVSQTLPNHHRQKTDSEQLLTTLGSLWMEGINVDWTKLYEPQTPKHIALPTYSFQKKSYWVEPDTVEQSLYSEPVFYKPVWSSSYLENVSLTKENLQKHHWIIFKEEASHIGNKIVSLLKHYEIEPIIITANTYYSELSSIDFKINPSEKEHYGKLFKTIKNTIKNPIILHLFSCSQDSSAFFSSEQVDKRLALGFYSALYLTQSYIEQIGDDLPFRGLIITAGTQRIIGNESIAPVNASLIGFCRVLTEEHPLLQFKLVDLNLDESALYHEAVLRHLISSCLNEENNDSQKIGAYRNGLPWDLSFVKENSKKKVNRFKNKGVYLLTGGLGGIGLNLCEAIAKQVSNPTFILLSRSALPDELDWNKVSQDKTSKWSKKIEYIKRLRELGAHLAFYQVDITDYEALATVINDCLTHFSTIDGVIHGAGIAGGGVLQLKTKEVADKVFLPKIHGSYHLAKALRGLSLDFVVFLSSIASLTGEPGQIDYCSANACLDAFATSPLFPSDFVMSINWNAWRDIGMAVETERPEDITFFDRGNDISPDQGQQLFLEAMKKSYSNLAISNYDFEQGVKRTDLNLVNPVSHVKVDRQDMNVLENYLAPTNSVEEQLAQLWQDTLGIEQIGINDDFFDLGGHSLKALSLIEKIKQRFHCVLSLNHMYSASTIAKMAELITAESTDTSLDIAVPLKVADNQSPHVFLCHPASGMVYCFDPFISQYPQPTSIYGLQDPSIAVGHMLYDNVFSMAEAYLSAIKKIQPKGPYYLIGYSFGGSLLYEVANLLREENESIGLLALIESWAVFSSLQKDEHRFKDSLLRYHDKLSGALVDLAWERMKLLLAHKPTKMKQDMVLIKAEQLFDDYKAIDHPVNGWSHFNSGNIICHTIKANHETIINTENSHQIINFLHEKGAFKEY